MVSSPRGHWCSENIDVSRDVIAWIMSVAPVRNNILKFWYFQSIDGGVQVYWKIKHGSTDVTDI